MFQEFLKDHHQSIILALVILLVAVIVIMSLSIHIKSLEKKEGVTSGYVPGGMDQGYFSGERFGNMGVREGAESTSQEGRQLQSVMRMGGYTDLQGALNAEKVAKFRKELGCASNVAFVGDEQEWRQAQSVEDVNKGMKEGMKGSLDDKLSRQMQGL